MRIIKKGILVFFLVSFSNLFGQSKILVKIVDADNNIPLNNVSIINYSTQKTSISNSDGTFQLNKTGTYLFKKEGYHEQLVALEDKQYYLIQLRINPSQLNEVFINSNHIPKKLKYATTSIDIISSKDIQLANNTDMAFVLNRTPGVFMQNGALNTNRITIRGIGSRNLFGTSKIRAYFKDIPLTNGSGETNIDDFELGAISRLEIIKGAISSIYGAGLGGTIHLIPKQGTFSKQAINNEFTIGSFGLIKNLTDLNLSTKKSSFKAIYSNTHSDGYRDNNDYNRETFTLNSNYYIKDKNELSFLASFVDLKAFIPSSLNENDFLNNPSAAAFTWDRAKGFEDTQRGVFGLSWKHQYTSNLEQTTSVFLSFKNGYEPRPFNILSEKEVALGLRSRIIGNSKFLERTLEWTFGGEIFRDNRTHKTFENLYQNFPPDVGSIKGNKLSDFKENRRYYNLFFESNYSVSKKTTLSFGMNLNQTWYDLKDRFEVTENNPDQSGSYKYKSILSPKFGVLQELTKNNTAFISLSHGFSPISLEETLLPNGQINTNLKPETGWNFEIGTRGSLLNNRLQYNVSIYRLNIKNLLVARRTSEDQFIGINAGETQHDGIEASLNFGLVSKTSFQINASTNFTVNNYKFKTFIDDNNNYSGNDLTGVPSEVFNAILDFDSKLGVYGNLNFQHVGQIPITDSNSLYSESYNLTNCKIGFKKNLNKNLKGNLFIGLNNIFDNHYASQILINASSFGNTPPRYYYPGNPVNYYAGINLNYTF